MTDHTDDTTTDESTDAKTDSTPDQQPGMLTADIAQKRQTVTETVEIDGETKRIKVTDITTEELKTYEAKEKEVGEDEVIRQLWDEYLKVPGDLAPADVPLRKVFPITEAMYRAWGAGEGEIDAAMAEYAAERAGN